MVDNPNARRVVEDTLGALISGLKLHAETAVGDIKEVAEEAAPIAVELAKDFANGDLTAGQVVRGLRKLELSVETSIARIARDEARRAAKQAVGNLLTGALGLLGAIF